MAIQHDQFDTIDASAVQSDWLSLNHDYFITEPRVLRDLIEIMRNRNRVPDAPGRDMVRRTRDPGSPWVLLPDEVMTEAVVGVESD